MIRVLIWGSSIYSRASSSAPVTRTCAHGTSSVWRFGSDSRHSTNNGIVDSYVRCIVRDLKGPQISPTK